MSGERPSCCPSKVAKPTFAILRITPGLAPSRCAPIVLQPNAVGAPNGETVCSRPSGSPTGGTMPYKPGRHDEVDTDAHATRATARLPGLDIDIVHRPAVQGGAEE